jgi:hypothetical protein
VIAEKHPCCLDAFKLNYMKFSLWTSHCLWPLYIWSSLPVIKEDQDLSHVHMGFLVAEWQWDSFSLST